MKEACLKQARRNQQFGNTPMGIGQCGLKAGEVAIFPVRYALDECPREKGSSQGPHPLPAGWPTTMPVLKTRSYTLRQLRDGWLYVWDSVDETFHEYQVTGELFTRHVWTAAQLNQDARHNPGQARPYLLYPRRSQLRIAWSPVQWTWRLCELMRSHIPRQHQWMRLLDLSAFCATGKVEHGGLLTDLGNRVADILLCGEPADNAPGFTCTMLPTLPGEAGKPFKPAIDEALVRGRVPEQDTALFIALDDPLGMIDDLSMSLAGRLMEAAHFREEHDTRAQSAWAVQSLAGFDSDALLPETLKDPVQKQHYTDDLYRLISVYDRIDEAEEMAFGDPGVGSQFAAAHFIERAQAVFVSKWGKLPDHTKWQEALAQWQPKRLWRCDVRFDEACQFLSQVNIESIRLEAHCQRSEQDLLAWLDLLDPAAESVFYDTCHESHASELLEKAYEIYLMLGNGKGGQEWLCKQVRERSSLFGTALFNFNPELARVIERITDNFSSTGKLDEQGKEGDGSTPPLDLQSPGDATSLATRANEIKGVLDLESVRRSRLYLAMSETARNAMATLIKVANAKALNAWHGLSGILRGALNASSALGFSVMQVLISTEIAQTTQLIINPNYSRDLQNWLMKVKALSNQIAGEQRVLQRPSPAHDQRAARRSLQLHEQMLKALLLENPHHITAKGYGRGRLPIESSIVQGWLSNLGQLEVKSRNLLLGSMEYLQRSKNWMLQNLGNALPSLVVGLNLWNLHSSAQKAMNDGHFTPDEWRIVSANAAYTANAVMALWVGPAWSRAGGHGRHPWYSNVEAG